LHLQRLAGECRGLMGQGSPRLDQASLEADGGPVAASSAGACQTCRCSRKEWQPAARMHGTDNGCWPASAGDRDGPALSYCGSRRTDQAALGRKRTA